LNEDETQVVATIRSGSVIGEIHLLHPYPHIATVRCGPNCDVLVLTKDSFKKVLGQYPEYYDILQSRLEV